MKKFTRVFVIVAVVALAAVVMAGCGGNSGSSSSSGKGNKFVVATDTTFAPFEFENEKGVAVNKGSKENKFYRNQ